MNPLTLSLIGSTAAPIAGGLLGSYFGNDYDDEIQSLLDQNKEYYNQLGEAPDTTGYIKDTSAIGTLGIERVNPLEAYQSKVAGLTQDQDLLNKQKASLNALESMSRGGLTPSQMLTLNQIQSQQARQNTADNAQILQGMQSRGIAGGGAELQAKMASRQNNANNAANQGMSLYGQSDEAKRGVLSNFNQILANLQNQNNQFNMQTANAADIATQAAWNNSTQARMANAQAQNAANTTMYNRNQQVADFNANQGNVRAQSVANRYNQNLSRVGGMTGANINLANNYMNQGKNQRDRWSGIGQGVGQGFMSYGLFNRKDKEE